MTGEMSAAEVTRENYPELFALRDALKRWDIASTPRPFDQYQGPYLAVPGVGKVWYSYDAGQGYVMRDDSAPNGWRPIPALLTIERAGRIYMADPLTYDGAFFTDGAAEHVHDATEHEYATACYSVRQASKRIAAAVRDGIAAELRTAQQ